MERAFNRLFGELVQMGFGLSHNYLVQVRGRKSGRLYSTPVNILEHGGSKYLVSARGTTQWVRNARVSGNIWLKKGAYRENFEVTEVSLSERPILLKAYLERYRLTVQRYFSVKAGADEDAFKAISEHHPVFQLSTESI